MNLPRGIACILCKVSLQFFVAIHWQLSPVAAMKVAVFVALIMEITSALLLTTCWTFRKVAVSSEALSQATLQVLHGKRNAKNAEY